MRTGNFDETLRAAFPYSGVAPLVRLVALVLLLSAATGAPAQAPVKTLLPGDAGGAVPGFDDAARSAEREAMVRTQIRSRDVTDQAVLDVMRTVPRHEFVPERAVARAYHDTPLPIGHGQTISQPFIVAFMTQLLDLEPDDRVLEVGTGSAYQAAVLAGLVREVVTIEIIEPLAESAAERLRRLGYGNVTVLYGDGYYGHAAAAPFDAIIVTAAASHVPPPLIEQLSPGGRLAIPVGGSWTQNLLLVEKNRRGETSSRNLMAVRFVPLTGDH